MMTSLHRLAPIAAVFALGLGSARAAPSIAEEVQKMRSEVEGLLKAADEDRRRVPELEKSAEEERAKAKELSGELEKLRAETERLRRELAAADADAKSAAA